MKNFLLIIAALFWTYNGSAQPSDFKNVWEHAPLHVPNDHRQMPH